MKNSTIQLLSSLNITVVVFCLLTIPGEIENHMGATAKYVAWAIIFLIGLSVGILLWHVQKNGEDPE